MITQPGRGARCGFRFSGVVAHSPFAEGFPFPRTLTICVRHIRMATSGQRKTQ